MRGPGRWMGFGDPPDASMLPNYGATNPFPSVAVPGGFSVTNNVQLVSARNIPGGPREWVVTLTPVTTSAAKSVAPWESSRLDGQTQGSVALVGALAVSIPTIPYNEGQNGFKVVMSWGAGGARSSAKFDYPMAGCSFGVIADNLDLTVIVDGVPTTVYADGGLIPVFGAYLVPGVSTGTVRLTDVAMSASAQAAQAVGWAIKPYSRYLHVAQVAAAAAGKLYSVTFYNDAGVDPLWATYLAQDAGSSNNALRPLPIPHQATYVVCTNADAAPPAGGYFWRPTWEMSFV